MRNRNLLSAVALSLGLLLGLLPVGGAPPAAAEGPRCFGMLQYDLDGDGQPDLAVLDCAIVTERDFVYVYDGGGDMRPGERWQDACDFRNDTWLFDVGADGTYDLALVFTQEGGRDVAYLYDDQNDDGRVSVKRSGNRVVVDESPYWTARIESGSTWVRPDGTLDQNVHVLVDGPLAPFGYPEPYLRQLRTDGKPKWEEGVVDQDGDGIPEYMYGLLLAPSPEGSQLSRSGVRVNTGRYRPKAPDGFLFWPLLGGASWYGSSNYFDSPFHLTYDWKRRKLVAADISGYPIEEGYHINTLQYFARGRVNYADFENPMAYYDLAGDRDGRPELFIRMAYFGQPNAIEEVTYSWNQYNTSNLDWHFKLGLLGKNAVQSQVQIGDFTVQTVPHDELPGWVVDHPWEISTFVADEGGAYASSEGIYEWAPLEGVIPDASVARVPLPGAERAVTDYLFGRSGVSPASYFDAIRVGFRAEYREVAGQVGLYFSPVDRRLHLLKAQKGVWNLGGGRELRYDATGGDYLNHWSLRQDGQEQRALWQVADQLVLADEEGVRLRRSDTPPALFTTAPPTDHDAWQRLGERIGSQDSPDAAAGADPRAMFDRLPGPVQVLPGTTARDVRATPDGFRFVLGLPAGGVPGVPFTNGLPPGEYVVAYTPAGGYRAAPLAQPGLTMGLTVERQALASPGAAPGGAQGAAYSARQPLDVAVRVANVGQEDAVGVRLQLVASRDGDAATPGQVVGTATLDADAGASNVVTFVWAPPGAGAWTLRALADRPAGSAGAEATLPVPIQGEAPPTPQALLVPQAPAVAGLLALLLGVGAAAVLATLAVFHPGGQGRAR